MRTHDGHLLRTPNPGPRTDEWRNLFDQFLDDVPPANPQPQPIGFAHNGFHVDTHRPGTGHAEPEVESRPRHGDDRRPPARHQSRDEQRPFWFESDGRHSRAEDPGDAPRRGRHSAP
jgi:hypothetical protein